MNRKIILLSSLNDNQVNQLAHLHQRVMHSLFTDLGLPFIERYYQIARTASSVIGMCALDEDGHLLGWAVGSPTPEQIARRLSEAKGWFITQMVRILFTNPKLIRQIIASSRSASITMKAGAVELTYIGVDSSARKQGLGRALLNAFVDSAREKNCSSVELSVEADNANAIALYTTAGFEIIASFKEGAFDRHRMELLLK